VVTNELDISDPTASEDGPESGLVRVLSSADVALSALLAGQVDLSGETSLSLEETPRQPAPAELLAVALTAAARRLAGVSADIPVESVTLRFIEQAYTDEPLCFAALDSAPDEADARAVMVRMESEEGRSLAEAAVRFQQR
jgi:hypothetical protein